MNLTSILVYIDTTPACDIRVDLAFRLRRAGYRAVFEPASRVLHHGGASHGRPAGLLLEQLSRNEERALETG